VSVASIFQTGHCLQGLHLEVSIVVQFVRMAKTTEKQKGANLSHPDRGTAKRLLEECSKPRRVARAWAGSSNVKIRGFRSDRSRCYAKWFFWFGYIISSEQSRIIPEREGKQEVFF